MLQTTKLSNLQLELLKVFSYEIPDKQLLEIKNLLAKYFAEKATDEMDKLWGENLWTNEKMEAWANEHMRITEKYDESSFRH